MVGESDDSGNSEEPIGSLGVPPDPGTAEYTRTKQRDEDSTQIEEEGRPPYPGSVQYTSVKQRDEASAPTAEEAYRHARNNQHKITAAQWLDFLDQDAAHRERTGPAGVYVAPVMQSQASRSVSANQGNKVTDSAELRKQAVAEMEKTRAGDDEERGRSDRNPRRSTRSDKVPAAAPKSGEKRVHFESSLNDLDRSTTLDEVDTDHAPRRDRDTAMAAPSNYNSSARDIHDDDTENDGPSRNARTPRDATFTEVKGFFNDMRTANGLVPFSSESNTAAPQPGWKKRGKAPKTSADIQGNKTSGSARSTKQATTENDGSTDALLKPNRASKPPKKGNLEYTSGNNVFGMPVQGTSYARENNEDNEAENRTEREEAEDEDRFSNGNAAEPDTLSRSSRAADKARSANVSQAAGSLSTTQAVLTATGSTPIAAPPAPAPAVGGHKVSWGENFDCKLCMWVMSKSFNGTLGPWKKRADVWNFVFRGQTVFKAPYKEEVLSVATFVPHAKLSSQWAERNQPDDSVGVREWKEAIMTMEKTDPRYVAMQQRVHAAIDTLNNTNGWSP